MTAASSSILSTTGWGVGTQGARSTASARPWEPRKRSIVVAFVVAEGIGAARVERIDDVLLARVELDLEGVGRPEAVDGPRRDLTGLGGLGLRRLG